MANNDNVVPTQHQGDTTKMNLQNDISVNGVKFRAGMNVEVPKNQADDVARMDYDAQQKRMELVRQPKEYIAPMGQDPRI
jgi:hypothetical protein